MTDRSNKSRKEKEETLLGILTIPQEITSKRGLMLWLLENLGKQWSRISCSKALEKLNIEDTKSNRHYWYDRKSKFKGSLKKYEAASKYQKPKVSFHNFNEASLFLSSVFTMRVRAEALRKGWLPTKAKNRFIQWLERIGWVKWFETGRVRIHVRKPVSDGKIMQLLANAFYNTELLKGIKEFTGFFRSFFVKSVKMTVFLGKKARIPRFRLEFDNGFNKLVVINDVSHPHSIEIQYYLLKDGEQFRQYLKDSQRTLDYSAETNIHLSEVLQQLLSPKPLRDDSSKMVV